MAGRDGTGPIGNGAMTGWGKGYCMTSRYSGFGKSVRRGNGRGLGLGQGAVIGTGYGCGRMRTILRKRLDMINAQIDNETKEE